MKVLLFIGLILLLSGCEKGGTKTLEERLAKVEERIATLEAQGKSSWILSRRAMTKGFLYGAGTPPPVSAFSSKEACLKAAGSMVDSDAIQTSVEPPEFESPTKLFKFTCLPSGIEVTSK